MNPAAPISYAKFILASCDSSLLDQIELVFDLVKKYGKNLDTVGVWINNNIPKNTPAYQKAIKELERIKRRAVLQPAIWLPHGNAEYVLKQFMQGAYKRQIMPVKFKDRKRPTRS